MTPSEAARLIGIKPSSLRQAIRARKLKARKVKSDNNQYGYVYDISKKDAISYRDSNQNHKGCPRGYLRPNSNKKLGK